MACLNGCDGIGLIRIENIYLRSKILPNEKYLVRQFTLLAEKTSGRAITLRLLDIGGDKQLPYLDIEAEDDTFLGLRGVRFLIRYENILKAQLRAIYIISKKYPIRILIPMVTLPFEIQHIRDIADVCRQELAQEHNDVFPIVPIGVMIETPAAVVNIKEIVKVSDFISIGTNDLIQYTMASSRENTSVAHYYEKGAAVIMDFISQCIVAANEQGIECGICGEMAGDERWIEQLIKLGVRQVSVAPHRIPLLKEEIRNISVQ
jgi:phosphotransferase system enzyme I (PtsI)